MNQASSQGYLKDICPVCNGSAVKRIYSGKDRMLSGLSKERPCRLELSRCLSCGMLFLNRLNYSLEDIHELYWKIIASNLPAGYSLENQKSPYLRLEDLEPYRRSGRLLEIGCGSGIFLKDAASRGWQVTGIEITAAAAAMARDKYGLKVITADFEKNPPLEDGSFDITVLWGLIEHLREPLKTLGRIKSLLRKDGLLVIYTPNANSLFHKISRLSHGATFGLVKLPRELVIIAMHTLYFTPATIRRALEIHNFSIEKIVMADINLDFIFKSYGNRWWSKAMFLGSTRCLQKISHIHSLHSHMLVLARNQPA